MTDVHGSPPAPAPAPCPALAPARAPYLCLCPWLLCPALPIVRAILFAPRYSRRRVTAVHELTERLATLPECFEMARATGLTVPQVMYNAQVGAWGVCARGFGRACAASGTTQGWLHAWKTLCDGCRAIWFSAEGFMGAQCVRWPKSDGADCATGPVPCTSGGLGTVQRSLCLSPPLFLSAFTLVPCFHLFCTMPQVPPAPLSSSAPDISCAHAPFS